MYQTVSSRLHRPRIGRFRPGCWANRQRSIMKGLATMPGLRYLRLKHVAHIPHIAPVDHLLSAATQSLHHRLRPVRGRVLVIVSSASTTTYGTSMVGSRAKAPWALEALRTPGHAMSARAGLTARRARKLPEASWASLEAHLTPSHLRQHLKNQRQVQLDG